MKSNPQRASATGAAKTPRFMADDLKELLDSPIAYHRILAHAGGGPLEGLFLSQSLYWMRRTNEADGWFWKTQAQWWEEIALSRKNQETARRNLIKLGLLEEERRGQQGRIFYRINLQALAARIRNIIDNRESEQTEMSESCSSSRPNRASPKDRIVQRTDTGTTTEISSSVQRRQLPHIRSFEDEEIEHELKAEGVNDAQAKELAQTHREEMRRRLIFLPFCSRVRNAGALLSSNPDKPFNPPPAYNRALAQQTAGTDPPPPTTATPSQQKRIEEGEIADLLKRATAKQQPQEESDEEREARRAASLQADQQRD